MAVSERPVLVVYLVKGVGEEEGWKEGTLACDCMLPIAMLWWWRRRRVGWGVSGTGAGGGGTTSWSPIGNSDRHIRNHGQLSRGISDKQV